MQTIYAMHRSGSEDIVKQEKFLFSSLESMIDLYLLILSTFIEIKNKELNFLETSKKKHLATAQEKNPNLKFVSNAIIKVFEQSKSLTKALEERKIFNWKNNDDTILYLLQDIKESDVYIEYIKSGKSSFQEDKDFIINLFTDVIAPNEKLYEYIEDYKLTWVDDVPVINTQIAKELNFIANEEYGYRISRLFKDEEDKQFASDLFRKTILNEESFAKEYQDKTPNWDSDRIAEIDTILLNMAICEFLKFPSIPLKVTINEYLELAKEYSTNKSSIFINGILDNLVKEFTEKDKIKKTGRGLI